MLILGAAAAALLIGILLGYIIRKSVSEKTIGSAEQRAQNIVLDAENQAETIKKEITIEAKEEASNLIKHPFGGYIYTKILVEYLCTWEVVFTCFHK